MRGGIGGEMKEIDVRRFVEPTAYKERGYPHEEWRELRERAPVEYFEVEGWPSFWAIVKHADVAEISRRPSVFQNAPGIALERETASGRSPRQMRSIINMDPPEHAAYRQIAAPWFTPAALRRTESVITETARRLVNGLGTEGECDFVEKVAARYPLHIVATILGVPEEDEPFLFEMTREVFAREELAAIDPDNPGRNREMFFDFFAYHSRLMEERRREPQDDLATAFARAEIDGKPIGALESFAYGLVTVTAGHETTRGSIAGGLLALLARPDRLRAWARDPSVTATAADEVLRFVSPVVYMMRTAVEDYPLRGRKIRAGDRVLLFHASANRDEEVFSDPDDLVLDRAPNPHLALGTGEHHCLGGRLARRMTGALLEEFVTRVEEIELVGDPVRTAANMIPSITRLPIRYRLRTAEARGRC